MLAVDHRQALAVRVAGHHLHERTDPLTTVAACGFQELPPGWSAVALHARAHGELDPSDVVTVNAMRGAAYVVPRREAAIFTAALVPDDAGLTAFVGPGAKTELGDAGFAVREALDLGSRRCFVLAEDPPRLEDPPAAQGVRLLGGYDPYVSQPDREALTPDAALRARRGRGRRGAARPSRGAAVRLRLAPAEPTRGLEHFAIVDDPTTPRPPVGVRLAPTTCRGLAADLPSFLVVSDDRLEGHVRYVQELEHVVGDRRRGDLVPSGVDDRDPRDAGQDKADDTDHGQLPPRRESTADLLVDRTLDRGEKPANVCVLAVGASEAHVAVDPTRRDARRAVLLADEIEGERSVTGELPDRRTVAGDDVEELLSLLAQRVRIDRGAVTPDQLDKPRSEAGRRHGQQRDREHDERENERPTNVPP